MKSEIKRDIIILINCLFEKSQSLEIYIRVGKFWLLFINKFPLKYQKDDKYLVTSIYLLKVVKEMNIASPFKFKKGKPKRYKFTKKRFDDAHFSE